MTIIITLSDGDGSPERSGEAGTEKVRYKCEGSGVSLDKMNNDILSLSRQISVPWKR